MTCDHKHGESFQNVFVPGYYFVHEGRWRVGGGINVALTVRINTEKAYAEDLVQIVRGCGFSCEIIPEDNSTTAE